MLKAGDKWGHRGRSLLEATGSRRLLRLIPLTEHSRAPRVAQELHPTRFSDRKIATFRERLVHVEVDEDLAGFGALGGADDAHFLELIHHA